MKKQMFIRILSTALLACAAFTARASTYSWVYYNGCAYYGCFAPLTQHCGTNALSGYSFSPITYYTCTAPNDAVWQSWQPKLVGQATLVDATFTCYWSCDGMDASGRYHQQLSDHEDHPSLVPGPGACDHSGGGGSTGG